MKANKSLKIQRVESILRELIPEAPATLDDPTLRGLFVTQVDCTKGKYDAMVYLDPGLLDVKEQRAALEHLGKARHHIESYCLQAEGWYRVPALRFCFDDTLERQNRLESLFAQIEKEIGKEP